MKAFMMSGGSMVEETTACLAQYLQDDGYEVAISNCEQDLLKPEFRECDLLVLNSCLYTGSGNFMNVAEREAFTRHFESGKGVVVMHSSIGNWDDWPEYIEFSGGRWDWGLSKHTNPDLSFVIETTSDHPILAGIPNSFSVTDEMYYNLSFYPGNHVLAHTSEAYGHHPMVWWRTSLNSKVAAIMIGHDEQAARHPQYKQLFLNACKWTNGGA